MLHVFIHSILTPIPGKLPFCRRGDRGTQGLDDLPTAVQFMSGAGSGCRVPWPEPVLLAVALGRLSQQLVLKPLYIFDKKMV